MSKVVLFTSGSYTSFIETEIFWLRNHDKDSTMVTSVSNPKKDTYSSTELVDFSVKSSLLLTHLLRHFWELLSLLLSDLFSKNTSLSYLSRWRLHLSTILRCSIIENDLYKRGVINSKDIFYCYYSNEFAIVLALAKKRGHIQAYSLRAHGRDVIEDREPITKKLPFQGFKYEHVKSIYCVSNATQNYIQNRYPEHMAKVKVSYLGTSDFSIGPVNSNNEEYTVISVGRVRNVKRFFLIAEMLQFVTLPIKWTHVGDIAENDPTRERFLESIKALDRNKNVRIELLGHMENGLLLEYYKSNFIDVLINSSEIEGLPVSIQEAISFGIPCLATDVGGTADIVNASTGVLLPHDFNPVDAASVLSDFLKSKSRDIEFRKGVRDFWFANFQAEINYPSFFATLSAQGKFEG